jgi:hypothetical protein
MRNTKGLFRGASLVLMTLVASTAGAQDMQTSPSAPVESLPVEQDWHPFSRSSLRIYMADVKGISTVGDVTRVSVAKPALQGEAGDYSYAEEVVEFRCAIKQSRSTTETEYGPDGALVDQYEDPSPWEGYSEASRDAFLASVVCDGERAPPPTWSSIRAWVDAGRR